MPHVNLQRARVFSRRITIAFFLVTFSALAVLSIKGFRLGVDFAGGVVFDFSIKEPGLTVDEVSKRIAARLPDEEFTLQDLGNDRFSFRIGNSQVDHDSFVKDFRTRIGGLFDGVEFHQIESIGPQAGKTLIKRGFYAITLSFVAMTLYLLFRFSAPFAFSAIVVLLCNLVFVAGVVSAFGLEMNLTMVASFLTIIGYCVNDTVVLYDRIRGNVASDSRRELWESIAIAVSQMLRRSIITSFVTMLAVFGIMFFSDRAIRNFAIALICGIIFGTIGSVFVASFLPLRFGFRKSSRG